MIRLFYVGVALLSIAVCKGQGISQMPLYQYVGQEQIRNPDKPTVRFGAIGGLNRTRINNIASSRHREGFFVGALFEVTNKEPKKPLGFQVELMYTQMGVNIKNRENIVNEADNSKTILNYFAVTALLKYNIEDFYLQGGVQTGLLVKAVDRRRGGEVSIWDEVTHYDLGLVLGVGHHLTKNLFIDLRTYIGGESILRDQEGPTKYNYGTSLGIGVKF